MPDPTPIPNLRALAEKATPGPWRVGIPGNFTVYAPDGLGELSGPLFGECYGPRRAENRKFIAACDPTTLLSLVTQLDTVTADRDRLREALEKVGNLLVGGHHSEAMGIILAEVPSV